MNEMTKRPGHLTTSGQVARADLTTWLNRAMHRDLVDFAAAVAASPVRERATWVALRDRWEQLCGLVDLDEPLLAACTDGFAALARGSDEDERAALSVRVTALGTHLERQAAVGALGVVEPAQRSLRDEAFRVCWLAKDLSRRDRRDLLARLGLRARLIWAVSHRHYERSDARAFRVARVVSSP